MDPNELDPLRRSAKAAAVKAGAPAAWVDDIADEAITRYFLQGEGVENARAWIRSVARNLAIDAHRREPNGGWGDMPVSAPGPGQHAYPSDFREPSPSLEVRQRQQVQDVLAVLTEIEQKLLVGTAAGLTAAELAEKYGYRVRSVTQKISAARKKVREVFPEFEDFDVQAPRKHAN